MKITAKILWQRRPEEKFTDNNYKRIHKWFFDGGSSVEASASPDIVPVPKSDPALIDPEEAFVASISSCHMLFFLSLAAKKKFIVEEYEDNAEALMGKNEEGKMAVLNITLRPRVIYGGAAIPDDAAVRFLHERAHAECFLASSVKTKITIE